MHCVLGLQLPMLVFVLILTMRFSWAGIVMADLDEVSLDASSRRFKRPSQEPTIGPAQSLMDPNDVSSTDGSSLKPSDRSSDQLIDEASDKPRASNSPGDVASDQPSIQPSKHRRRLKRPTLDPNAGPTRRPRRSRKPSISPSV